MIILYLLIPLVIIGVTMVVYRWFRERQIERMIIEQRLAEFCK